MSTGGYPELHTWDAKGVCKNCGDYDVEPWLGEKRSRLACRKQLAPLAGPNPGCAMLVLEAARDATKEAE